MFSLTAFQFASAYHAGYAASFYRTIESAIDTGMYAYWIRNASVKSAFMKGVRDGHLGC